MSRMNSVGGDANLAKQHHQQLQQQQQQQSGMSVMGMTLGNAGGGTNPAAAAALMGRGALAYPNAGFRGVPLAAAPTTGGSNSGGVNAGNAASSNTVANAAAHQQQERTKLMQLQYQRKQLEMQLRQNTSQQRTQHHTTTTQQQKQQQQQQHHRHRHHHHHQQQQQQQHHRQQHHQQQQQHHHHHHHHHPQQQQQQQHHHTQKQQQRQYHAQYLQQQQQQQQQQQRRTSATRASPSMSMTRPPDFTSTSSGVVVQDTKSNLLKLQTVNTSTIPRPVPVTMSATNSQTTSSSTTGGGATTANALVSPTSMAAAATTTTSTTTSTVLPASLKRDASSLTSPTLTTEQTQRLVRQCNWVDRTVYLSRQLLGGSTVNGFSKAIASAQRIKKQRARQAKQQANSLSNSNNNSNNNNSSSNSNNNSSNSNSNKGSNSSNANDASNNNDSSATGPKDLQQEEEALKKETMNLRTAKKIRSELKAGLEFCKSLHETVRSILRDVDPNFDPLPLMDTSPVRPRRSSSSNIKAETVTTSSTATARSSRGPSSTTRPSFAVQSSHSNLTSRGRTAAAAKIGDPSGSTLRKLRKHKFPVVPTFRLPEHDSMGKRLVTKKEHAWRIFELSRFRALQKGDPVAARVSSRDLWILARVVEPYPGAAVDAMEFLQLTDNKRVALFPKKVIIKDIEEKDGSTNAVSRQLVLPLPRTHAEAADWGSRCKKGARVYAMYPETTSLYSGTVVDNTTYCCGEDDIIVVEFDEDEHDATGSIRQYHIPARFVTLIPREFPASHQSNQTKKRGPGAAASGQGPSKKRNTAKSHKRNESTDSALDGMLDEMYNDPSTRGKNNNMDLMLDFGL